MKSSILCSSLPSAQCGWAWISTETKGNQSSKGICGSCTSESMYMSERVLNKCFEKIANHSHSQPHISTSGPCCAAGWHATHVRVLCPTQWWKKNPPGRYGISPAAAVALRSNVKMRWEGSTSSNNDNSNNMKRKNNNNNNKNNDNNKDKNKKQ